MLLTLPYSFSQLGMLSGILLQIFYGLLGSWTAYLISVLYVEYRSRKEKENVSFKNHVIQVGFAAQNHHHHLFLIKNQTARKREKTKKHSVKDYCSQNPLVGF